MQTIHRAWRGGKSEWRTHMVTVLSSSVAFLCLAFALLTVFNLRGLQQRWEAMGRLSVYLTSSASADDVLRLKQALEAIPAVEQVREVTSEEARRELLQAAPTAVLKALPSDAFPASLEVRLVEQAPSDALDTLAERIGRFNYVESIETYRVWSQRVARFVGAAILVAAALALVVFLAVVTTVSSSTKLMLERRRAEVEVLRVVGATAAYVRRPFMVEGAVQGAVGATAALLLAGAAFLALQQAFSESLTLFLGASPHFLPFWVCVSLIAVGGLLGSVAAGVSLRRSVLV